MSVTNVKAFAVDFDETLSPEETAQNIINELLSSEGPVEVGYPFGKRTVFNLIEAELEETNETTSPKPESDWVALVTGGGRGITAEITRRFVCGGMTVIVVGRSSISKPETASTAKILDIAELKQFFLREAQAGGKLLTPVQVENKIKALQSERETRSNLGMLRQAGVKVEYHSVDVRNADEFGQLINQIYQQYGRLDAVIHGSGVIEDKLLKDKSLDSFDRVFDTKVDSTFILSRFVRADSLKLMVLFSSIAGRIGNPSQSDYACANEVLNRFAWYMNEKLPDARVVAINWGPWESVGMASEIVNRRFTERGIIPISPSAGCNFFIREIRYAGKNNVEVVAGKGPWQFEEISEIGDDGQLGNLINHINGLTENFWLM